MKLTRLGKVMRLRAYTLVQRAVEDGISAGLRRARKHIDDPDDVAIECAVEDAVMQSLAEVIDFEDGE